MIVERYILYYILGYDDDHGDDESSYSDEGITISRQQFYMY